MRRKAYGIGAGLPSRLALCVVVAAVTLLYPPGAVRALSCMICDPDQCKSFPEDQCHAGVTIDVCGCCRECAREANESCGGTFGILGKCGPGLKCFIAPKVGEAISEQEDGLCKGR